MTEAGGTRREDLLDARKVQDKGSERTSGHATTSGQDYEVALCCLVFLRALRHADGDFFLLSNFARAGNLDDVVLFHRPRGDAEYSAVLVQAKYREKPRRKKLTGSYPFSLAKYSASFADFSALCAAGGGGVPLPGGGGGGLLEVGRVSAVLYSNDGCCLDDAGVARDVTADPDVRPLRDLLDTGGRLLRVVTPAGLGLPEDFARSLTLFTEQTSLDDADGHLERDLRALTASADVAALRTLLRTGVQRWWGARVGGGVSSLTARSPEWTDVLRLQAALLNGPRPNLDFSPEALATLGSALEQHELTWITVADERQAWATRGRLLQAVAASAPPGGSSCCLLVLDAAASWRDQQVEALWGTAACPTLTLDLTSSPPSACCYRSWSRLLGAVRGHRRLAVIALHGTTPPEARWFHFRAETTWSVLDEATRDRLLVADVSLQGSVVALRDVLGGAPPGLSDETISALCDPAAAGVLRLGVEPPDLSSPDNYVERCLERTVRGKLDIDDLRRTKTLVFSRRNLLKYKFTVLDIEEVENMNEIAQTTLVPLVYSQTKIRKECCRLGVRGVSDDPWDIEFTEFLPLTWLCEDRVVIVEGVAGVGKSTFVTVMCSKVKQRFPASWVLRCDLAKHTDFISRGDFSDIPGFLLRVLPGQRQGVIRELLEHSIYVAGNVFFFVDAFDEISPDYTAQCCQLLKGIASAFKFQQMVVTTRSVNTRDVEEALGVKAFSLPVFSEDEQDLFLERFCKCKDMLLDRSTISSLREAVGPVLQVPLICRMAAEVLVHSDYRNVLRYKNPWLKVLLYERFVRQTTVNRQAEKLDLPQTLHGERLLESQAKEHLRNLQALAVRKLMPVDQLPGVQLSSDFPDEKLGLVVGAGKSVDFEHRTFAEFFLGRWLARHWQLCPRELLRERLARENWAFVAATLSWSLFEDSQPHLAVARGEDEEVVRWSETTTTDRGGRTVLHVAAMTPGVQLLPDQVSGRVLDDVLGVTAAGCAEMCGNWEFLEALAARGTPLDGGGLRLLTDRDAAKEAVFKAVERDLPRLVDVILRSQPGARDLGFPYSGYTLLHVAAVNDSVKVIGYLLTEQQHVVDVENGDRETAFQVSATCGHVKAMTLLLEKGADLEKRNVYGLTPLLEAARNGRLDVLEPLLEMGADVNARDGRGNTATILAADQGHLDAVDVLLEKGADTNVVNADGGNTALMSAAHQGHSGLVRLLLDKGRADADRQNGRGFTALMLAARSGAVDVVEVLLQRGADADLRNQDGDTATLLAAHSGLDDVCHVLREIR